MKRIGIEELLRWAFRDELPKAQAESGFVVFPKQFGQAWGGMERFGELLTIIDAPENKWGVVPDLTARSEPHPDAVAVGEAVARLDELGLGIPDDWHPLGDMAGLEGADDLIQAAIGRAVASATLLDAAGERRLKATPRWLVVRVALTGILPEWRADLPSVEIEKANGKPRWFVRETIVGEDGPYEVELDGLVRSGSRRLPKPGAYQKRFLDPDPTEAAVARAEYEVWRAALDVLAEELAGPKRDEAGRVVYDREGRAVPCLSAHAVQPSIRPMRPWTEGEAEGGRVLPDLSQPVKPAQVGSPGRATVTTPDR